MWRDSKRVAEWLHKDFTEQQLNKIEQLHHISRILSGGLADHTHVFDKSWATAAPPSKEGLELLKKCNVNMGDPALMSVTLLLIFFHQSALIDVDSSDPPTLWRLVAKLLDTKQLRLPHRLGRDLYDRYNDTYNETKKDHLTPSETNALLSNDEQGVFQLGDKITGPLGIVYSNHSRLIPPTTLLPLWHCRDTGCQHVHNVQLFTEPHPASVLVQEIYQFCLLASDLPSEWEFAVRGLHRQNDPKEWRELHDMPALIAESITGADLDSLFLHALRSSEGKTIRSTLDQCKGVSAAGSPESISEKLDKWSKLQLLLCLSDEALAAHIDSCIDTGAIVVPETEVRRPKVLMRKRSNYDERCAISSFGVRSNKNSPILFLSSSIWKEYEKTGQLGDLAWKCNKSTDNPTLGNVIDYIKQNGPRSAISNLVFTSQSVCVSFCNKLNVKISHNREDGTIDKILWKSGFSPPRFDSKYNRIRRQINALSEAVIRYRGRITEDDRDSLRSLGVNIFVSLENILEEIVAFNLWALASDHFLETKFTYRPTLATRRVAEVLGESIETSGGNFRWDASGGNTLGTLCIYARAAANWMESLLNADRKAVERPLDEYPHYAKDENREFPFKHNHLWADAPTYALADYVKSFEELVSQLEACETARVRNGLDHFRTEAEFPSSELILSCITRLGAALDYADVNRFSPKIFWGTDREVDRYGLEQIVFEDYMGRKIIIGGPNPVSGMISADLVNPILIPYGNLLGLPHADVFFRIQHDSEYSRYWDKYPRRPVGNVMTTDAQVDIELI
jgi:hypothetical protein